MNHPGIGEALSAAAEDVADAYRRAMRDGRVCPAEHAELLGLTASNVARAAEVNLSLTVISTVARCASGSRHRRRLLAEWGATDLAVAAD